MPEPVAAWEYLQAELNAWDNAEITVSDAQRAQQLQQIEEQKHYVRIIGTGTIPIGKMKR